MELTRAIKARHMVRTFDEQPVQRAILERILDDARRTPSAGNTQATEFLVLHNRECVQQYWATTMKEEVQSTFRWQSLLTAPVLVLVLTRPQAYLDRYSEQDKERTGRGESEQRWPVPYWWVDSGAVLQNLLLLVTQEGLGGCLFAPFDHEAALRNTFSIPEDRRIVATVAIGHPVDASQQAAAGLGRSSMRQRPTVQEMTHWGGWQE